MSSQIIKDYEASQLRKDTPDFRPGDTVRVSVKITEGDKERIQDFEGVCIRRLNDGLRETFTVRRVRYGVGMERIFPLHSPKVDKIQVTRRGKVRRAKLYYLRELRGKKARIIERKGIDADMVVAKTPELQEEAPAAPEATPVAAPEPQVSPAQETPAQS